jgi:cytochrome c oxidase subunit 2
MTVTIDSVFAPAGPVAQAIADLGLVLVVGAAVVFAIVIAALVWALRHRGARDAADGSRIARRWIVGGGIVFPVLVLTALLVHASLRTERLTGLRDTDALVITVKGHLWWWELRYRDPAGSADVVVANELHIPVGRPVRLALVSDDVIHSLWLPALAGKADLVPGRVTHLRLQADRAGVFRGPCAEYCGDQHARMVLTAVAQESGDFDRWLSRQASAAEVPTGHTELQRGLAVFEALRCPVCHEVRGLTSGLAFGPDLTHLAGRLHLAAGTLPMGPDALAAWIADPQKIKPGARMPAYGAIDPAAMRALVAFLMSLE